jgi:hypothetical protein
MSTLDWTILILGVLAFAVVSAVVFWDDLQSFIDPHGSERRAARQMGYSDRDARAHADSLSPWYLAIVSLLGLGGLLSFFLS